MEDGKYTGGRSRAGWSMHLSSRGEFGQDPTRAAWPKGLRGPPLPLLPLRIEVGWIRLASKKPKCKNFRIKAKTSLIWICVHTRAHVHICEMLSGRADDQRESEGRRVCRGGTGPLPAPELVEDRSVPMPSSADLTVPCSGPVGEGRVGGRLRWSLV